MSLSLPYNSIAADVCEEFVVKGSRFIAHCHPCSQAEEAEDYVQAKAEHFTDATHNCFAYKIGVGDRAVFRYSDDGEPSGTAGRPIYQTFDTKQVTNLAMVVTRYFGGIKLGTGGLVRAYSSASLKALEKAEIVVFHPRVMLSLRLGYQFTKTVHKTADKFGAVILNSEFGDEAQYLVAVDANRQVEFEKLLENATHGQVRIERK